MIRLESITKTFPGVKALDDVSFEIFPGEVHALCGENGAGKSTLMRVLSGIYPHRSYTGRILRVEGGDKKETELCFYSVNDAAGAGIAIVHQELALLPEMSVLDNLFLGRELSDLRGLDKRREALKAGEHFARLGFAPSLEMKVKDLSLGQQQRLEIARALLSEPSVLILDEPTSALPEDDARSLLGWIRTLADSGTACVYISHRMEEVFRISDRITVLRDGKSIWTKLRKDVTQSDVITAMVDRPPTDMYAHTPLPAGDSVCHVKDLEVRKSSGTILKVDDLQVCSGEIVGLAGIMGAGRTCLLRSLTGSLNYAVVKGRFTGPDRLDGDMPRHPQEAGRRGIFLIPEDRKRQALFLDESIVVNTTAANVATFHRHARIDRLAMWETTLERMKQFSVKAPSAESVVRNLSGGNQQKILLCRAAEVNPRLLLLDEPTRGIDVGAKEAIYRQMEVWTREGWGILWSSSELQELLAISDRIYVLANGRVTAHFDQRPFVQHEIMVNAATN